MKKTERTNLIERRRAGRLADTELQCTLGLIQNISASGMVLLCRDTIPKRASVLIGVGEDHISVFIRRIWIKRLGYKKRLVGYRFIDPPENLLGVLRGAKLPKHIMRVI
ncbi:MAG: hypothetical protein IID30_03850 [Planctomycetes bacterium]|nr:hypothetical protein [Planctomycetota bacterium]MCH7573267.1 hypothetical protein [Planctomycetota bacterium]MCH7603117.1 hypothetical protein [Planctomycetota bacterium]